MTPFEQELEGIINKYSLENASDTPDFILAEYLSDCLSAFNQATRKRTDWYKLPVSGLTSTSQITETL